VGEAVIRQAMYRLTMADIRDHPLAERVFSYDEPEQMPDFQISIAATCRSCCSRQVRIDHGEKPRKMVSAKRDDQCYGCTVTDCSPAIRLKHPKGTRVCGGR